MTVIIRPKRKYLVHKFVKKVGVSGDHQGRGRRKKNAHAPEQQKRVMRLLPNGKTKMEDYS